MSKKTLSTEEILHIAKLGNLTLTEKEVELFKKQLSSVIEYIDKLQEVDTKNVEPLSQTTGLTDIFRKDEPDEKRTLIPEEALKNTKSKENNLFKVKAVLTE
ncbi:MAG: Aspartyl/glutamyl-tRNA(Asn/Gln) amidotransferase subunit C [Candidatus Roizmanbacteria bacterium GW2011_GWC2_37_13]|uniref:Aspartyl/glutamyl-tRNA(Asn/Gln) amidotransferase subunit C n=1 Tax=Candidatus Roizmanbacteria bacterium GW2011_GWC2_37_13 TaxID=1618486 RepID=A0A0G0GGV4_9BACT|nr:MAG: Aspartyl/glutamyl-tRNA(Asn/Gln) amidotransferase subunit C [Candidatus Roizmanbacteria bacterium GW2011_GWC1_37_12]KKQ25305.1 MAG: Aspartyl/glutamyl-tRNA(Asn/Gln) amidotransferase subunit C [Candidatus Roizmanbacteria bacterium GW2011_GWC2_37_13]